MAILGSQLPLSFSLVRSRCLPLPMPKQRGGGQAEDMTLSTFDDETSRKLTKDLKEKVPEYSNDTLETGLR